MLQTRFCERFGVGALLKHQQVEAAGRKEKLVHRVQHMLPAEVPNPRPKLPIRTVKRQRTDHDAVGLRLVRVHLLVGQTLHQRGLARLAPAHYDQLHFRSAIPIAPRVAK